MTFLLRLPFMLGFLLVMVVSNWLAGTLGGMLPPHVLTVWGISHQSILDGDVFRLMTGTFLSHDFGMLIRQICFAAVVIGAYEWSEGTWRAIVVFFSIDILGSILVLFVILPLLVGLPYAVSSAELLAHDVGMSAGGFGLIGALFAKNSRGWLLLALTFIAISIKIWIRFEPVPDTAHLLCLLLGFVLQSILNYRRAIERSPNPKN